MLRMQITAPKDLKDFLTNHVKGLSKAAGYRITMVDVLEEYIRDNRHRLESVPLRKSSEQCNAQQSVSYDSRFELGSIAEQFNTTLFAATAAMLQMYKDDHDFDHLTMDEIAEKSDIVLNKIKEAGGHIISGTIEGKLQDGVWKVKSKISDDIVGS